MSQADELLDVGAFLSKDFKGQSRRKLKYQPVLLPSDSRNFLILYIEVVRPSLMLAGMTQRDLDSKEGLLFPKWGNLDRLTFIYTH